MNNNINYDNFIAMLKEKHGQVTYDIIKDEILTKNENNESVYYIHTKDMDNLFMLYYIEPIVSKKQNREKELVDLENSVKSLICCKTTLKPICSQNNKIIYNDDVINLINNSKWENIEFYECFEGTILMVYNHDDKWYVSTRRCIESNKSLWNKNKSYYDMFIETIDDKFTFDDLDKNVCYQFILVHHQNKNIIMYNFQNDSEYKKLYLASANEKFTMNRVECNINGVINVNKLSFDNLDQVYEKLNKISENDEKNKVLSTEGYIVRIYDDDRKSFIVCKLQTEIYQKIAKIKPNNNNIHQNYLELYQKDNLKQYLAYYGSNDKNILRRTDLAVQNMTTEILKLYYLTRHKKNQNIYQNLTNQYKKVLYNIHGLYINNKKSSYQSGENDVMEDQAINFNDVYQYLKKGLKPYELRQLFFDRKVLQENPVNTFINKNNEKIAVVTSLMMM